MVSIVAIITIESSNILICCINRMNIINIILSLQDEVVYPGAKLTTILTEQNMDNIPVVSHIQETSLNENYTIQNIPQMEKEVNNYLITCVH